MSQKLSPAEVEYFESGYAGFERIADTSQHDGPYLFLVCQDGSVSFDPSGTSVKFGDTPDGADSFNKGRKVLGPFESVQLTGGVVYAYRAHFEEEPTPEYPYSPTTPGDKER